MTPLSKHRKLYTSLRPALALPLNQHIRYSCTCEMTDLELLYKLSPFQPTVQSVPHSIPTPKPRKVISTHDLCIIYGSDLASVASKDFECLNVLTIDESYLTLLLHAGSILLSQRYTPPGMICPFICQGNVFWTETSWI